LAALIVASSALVNAAPLEKGNPAADYKDNTITLADNSVIDIKEGYTALFINGALVTEYEVIIRNDRSLVPVRLVSEELGAEVGWDGNRREVIIQKGQTGILLSIDKDKATVNGKEVTLDYPAVIYKDRTYVPLRFVAESLDATVEYATKMNVFENFFYDTDIPLTSPNTIVRNYPNIIIDEKCDPAKAASQEDALDKAKATCLEGLVNFRKTVVDDLVKAGAPKDRFDAQLNRVDSEIERMLYLGEVTRFYKFTIGLYDILYDKFNGRMFFEIYASGIIVK
jgi:hypothetical protein